MSLRRLDNLRGDKQMFIIYSNEKKAIIVVVEEAKQGVFRYDTKYIVGEGEIILKVLFNLYSLLVLCNSHSKQNSLVW